MGVLSSVFIIVESNTRNTEFLSSWLQKMSLEQLLFQKVSFSVPLVFKNIYFLERTSFFVVLYAATTFLNFCELWSSLPCQRISSHKLYPCFDIVFAWFGVIPSTKNGWIEIVAVAERYISQRIKEAAVQNMSSCKISWWKNVNKKGKHLFLPNLQYCQSGRDDAKNRTFFIKMRKIS